MRGIYRVTFQDRRGKLNACLMVKFRFKLGRVTAKPFTQHGALEYGSDLHVNERQKIRHYRARPTEEEEEEEEEE